MKKGGRLEKFRDGFLTPWWSRYLLVPVLTGAPGVVAAYWFKVHDAATGDYALKGLEAEVIAAVAIWAGVLSAIKSGLNDLAAFTVKELKDTRDRLMRLVGNVRWIIGAKSRRFSQALVNRDMELGDPGIAFMMITRPDLQIEQIVRAIHGYFDAETEVDERIVVQLMRWDGTLGHPIFADYFPPADPPQGEAKELGDRRSLAGRAFLDRTLVISDDISSDPNYLRVCAPHAGSMFAYPVEDDLAHEIRLVVNVHSTAVGRFKTSDATSIRTAMEVFGDRLLLEDRLERIRNRVESLGRGGRI